MIVKSVAVKLRITEESAAALDETFERFNAACNRLSAIAWETQTFRAYDLHKMAYYSTRAEFGLPAQLTVRAIAKVADSYKTDRSQQHTFGPRSAVVYDARCFRLVNLSSVELTTTRGRFRFVMAHGGKQRDQLAAGVIGEADLLFRDGKYYLSIAVKTPDPPPVDTSGGVLGVDLGIVELATDSEGNSYSGQPVKDRRRQVQRHRALLQKCGTKSAKRHLRKIKRRQSRYVKHTNHCISKSIVATALHAQKALALEDLTGIRQRASSGLNREMRRQLGSWAFADLGEKIAYKAAEVGIPVILVDPRNTSRTCSACGFCEKANRKSQAVFHCLSCGFDANADWNAAVNIGARAAIIQPIVSTAVPLERNRSSVSDKCSRALAGA